MTTTAVSNEFPLVFERPEELARGAVNEQVLSCSDEATGLKAFIGTHSTAGGRRRVVPRTPPLPRGRRVRQRAARPSEGRHRSRFRLARISPLR
jgi:hypothetical protein